MERYPDADSLYCLRNAAPATAAGGSRFLCAAAGTAQPVVLSHEEMAEAATAQQRTTGLWALHPRQTAPVATGPLGVPSFNRPGIP